MCSCLQELILFSRADLERSIPNMVDGLKPGQRKILFACFKRNLRKEIKVSSALQPDSTAELLKECSGSARLRDSLYDMLRTCACSQLSSSV